MNSYFNISILTIIFVIQFYSVYNSKLLVIPLNCFKKNNIDLPFKEAYLYKYLIHDISKFNIINDWNQNSVHGIIQVGLPKYNYYMDFDYIHNKLLHQVSQKYQKTNNINYYNISHTYTNVSEYIVFLKDNGLEVLFTGNDVFHFTYMSDINDKSTIYIENKNLNYSANLDINNVSERPSKLNLGIYNTTFNFAFGMELKPSIFEKDQLNLFQILKSMNIIESYDFIFDYYNNININKDSEEDEIGRWIIGDFKELKNNKNIYKTKMSPDDSSISYSFIIDKLYMEDPNIKDYSQSQTLISINTICKFKFNQNLFIGMKDYQNIIDDNFFNKYLIDGKQLCEKGYDSSSLYRTYKCSKDILKFKDKFPVLKFHNKELNFTFEFNFDDLFREYLDHVFFLVAFPYNDYVYWELGKIFLKKYKIYFNVDSKEIKMIHYIIPNKPSATKVILIILLIITIIAVLIIGICLGRKLKFRRKIRAMEIEDKYEYIPDN